MPQLDFPDSPTPGQTYAAPNGITYTYDNSIGTGVWKATVSSPLSVTPGSISGAASVGSTLTYTPGTASGGAAPYTYAYQWKANGVNIAGATGLTYTVVAGDAGKSLTVTITATDSAAATANATTAPVVIPTALAVTAGSISGTAKVGLTLTYTPGVASGGTSPYTYTYQWNANGAPIGGATGLTYIPVAGNIGQTLTVTITATDSTTQTATATTAPTAAVTASTIPTTDLNLSPSTGPTASNTVATGTWNGTTDSLSAGGCLEVKVGAGAFGAGPFTVNNGDLVEIRWKAGVACTGAADGTAISGTLTAGSGGSNTYNFTVDTTPTNFSFAPLSNQTTSTQVTSASITLAGPNVTTYLTTTGGTLTGIEASINGGAFVAIPASGTTMPVEPGQTIQIRGTTGGANSTGYTAILSLGGVSTTWTATTAAPIPTIATPAISSPANGTTNLNPATNSPAGIELQTTSVYTPTNGAGSPQTSSEWEVYRWVGGGGAVPPTSDPPGANYAAVTGSPFVDTTSPFTSQLVPQSALAVSSTYYARLRYRTTNATATDSAWSAWSSFTTASSFAIPPGSLLGGGYFAGQINDGGTIYNLIVAPVTSGSLQGQYGGATPTTIQYKTSASADTPSATVQNQVYGGPTTDLFKASGVHPVFSTFINGATGPNAGAFNLATGGAGGGTGIGGFNDWYLPAKNELAVLYFFLKPNTTSSDTSSGSNPNSVAPYTPNTVYGPGFPNQTTSTLFQAGGAQAFSTATYYWSSSEYSSGTTSAWNQSFNGGFQSLSFKNVIFYARAVRRVAA